MSQGLTGASPHPVVLDYRASATLTAGGAADWRLLAGDCSLAIAGGRWSEKVRQRLYFKRLSHF